jgi:hypothetical protein
MSERDWRCNPPLEMVNKEEVEDEETVRCVESMEENL